MNVFEQNCSKWIRLNWKWRHRFWQNRSCSAGIQIYSRSLIGRYLISINLKPFLSDVRVNALIEINLHKLNLFPCYEKLGDSISPSFDRFRATRFQKILQALQQELQPYRQPISTVSSLEKKSYQVVGSQSQYIKGMLNKITPENNDFYQLLLMCTVNIEQQKLLEEMVNTYESYRTSQIQKYLGRAQKNFKSLVLN